MRVNPLAAWLGSCPGPFFGHPESEALEAAYQDYCNFAGENAAVEYPLEFTLLLKSAGSLPAPQFNDPNTGLPVTRIQLPEKSRPPHTVGLLEPSRSERYSKNPRPRSRFAKA